MLSGDGLPTAVIGAGRWGRNLIRNIAESVTLRLAAVCDLRPFEPTDWPGVRRTTDPQHILTNDDIAAVLIATPPETHADLAEAALNAQKHVLCEKPLALDGPSCRRLGRLAARNGLCLLVDCTPVYLTAIERARTEIPWEMVRSIRCRRFSHRPPAHPVDVWWDLAPHDLAVLDAWLGSLPREWTLQATSEGVLLQAVSGPCRLEVEVGYGAEPLREIIVSTSERTWMLHQDQIDPEPLQTVVAHFAEAIRNGEAPRTGAAQAARIADVLTGVRHVARL